MLWFGGFNDCSTSQPIQRGAPCEVLRLRRREERRNLSASGGNMITSGYIWPMPTYLTGEEIALGDWVKVYVPRLGVWHHGVARRIYPDCDGFVVEIAHNMKASGVTVSDWYDFSEGDQVHLHRQASSEHVPKILARVEANIGKPYSVFAQNCEHFASFAFTGRAESKSIQGAGLITALALIIGLLTRR
jgi:Lecithin retinol acyltransferase